MKKDKLKKILWYPEAKDDILAIYIWLFILFVILIIATLCLGKEVIKLFLGIMIVLFVIMTCLDGRLYATFLKVGKKRVKIYYLFFNHKKLKRSEIKISFTEIANLFGSSMFYNPREVRGGKWVPDSYFGFVLYTKVKFIDNYYLKQNLDTVAKKKVYMDYSWKTLRNRKFIVIDGTYKNYKYLRQFFGVDKFCDTRGIEENKIAEYEEKLRQETLTESI